MEATILASAFVLVFIFGRFCCVVSTAESIRLARNKEFDGLTCPVSQTIFNEDRADNKIQCASLCTEASSCVGFFHHPQTKDCVGCSSFVKDDAPELEGMQFYARSLEYFEGYSPPIDCGELPPIRNGFAILDKVDGTFYNDTATVTCERSWKTTYKIACNKEGSWETASCPTYMLVATHSDWWQSKVACENRDGRLADIKSEEEQNFIVQNSLPLDFETGHRFWVGGSGSNSSGYVWLDGTALSGQYTNWHSGEPNGAPIEQCIQFLFSISNYFWNDEDCNKTLYGGVCEFD